MMTIGSQVCRLDLTGVEDACDMAPLPERDAAPTYRTLHRVDASKNSMRLWALIGRNAVRDAEPHAINARHTRELLLRWNVNQVSIYPNI
jgi:hypothetical protein